jgi:hypothetical protein
LENSTRASTAKASLGVIVAVLSSSCASAPEAVRGGPVEPDQPTVVKAEKPFAAAGSVEMQLEGGIYEIHPASGDRIRVSFGGNTGGATAEVTTVGAHANLSVKDTPHNNFKAAIEVPQTTDLVLRLTAGNLDIGGITGNKDIDSKAGNIEISVGHSDDYSSVDASVNVGNLDAGPFGQADPGIAHHFTWSGRGKYTLRVNLGAGNLEFKGQ